MNPLSCFIIDDEPFTALLTNFIQEASILRLAGSSVEITAAMNKLLSTDAVDVLFINIDQAADYRYIHDYVVRNQLLVIVTSMIKENAFRAFEHGFFDYLLKPLTRERLFKTLNRVFNSRRQVSVSNSLYIQCGNKGKIVKTLYDDIKYIEANQNFVTINTIHGD